MTTIVIALIVGACIAGGVCLIAAGTAHHPPSLASALSILDGSSMTNPSADNLAADDHTLARLGSFAYRALRIPVSPRLTKALVLQQRSVGDFYAEKLICALIGLIAPTVVASMLVVFFDTAIYVPVLAALLGAVVGFFVPDLLLLRRGASEHTDAREALFTYFDLVVLERLANRSGPQALSAAAEVSNHPVFVQIRQALDRARLEQSAPYPYLRSLADELNFSELKDIADVMRLDESGAALATVLRSRVKELRDAHLTQQTIAAQTVSERMTLPMTVPTLIFTLILFAAPLLRLVTSS